ncbi:alpha/beta fold hydrolase [Dactylosporangium sp. CA-092794]|uniref:alpha/beta fold hydrolase n=1 Tax=Dactylosporangium sp. CA-092794 TaxID=3239929 RepID=UPI003D8C6AF9
MDRKYTKEETDRFVEIDGIRLHYNEAGDGPALICTHGGGPGANAWDNTKWVLDALAEHFRVFLIDMPGFGESQMHVSREGVPMDIFCARLKRGFIDHLGIDKAHLYGSSAFSAAALRFGIDYPGRVGRIVIQAYAPSQHPGPTAGLKAVGEFAKEPSMANMERMMEQFTPNPELRTRAATEARFRAANNPDHLQSRLEMNAASNSDLVGELRSLTTEVLVTWGNHDGMIPVAGILAALEEIPNVRAHLWGGNSGHFVATEHPEDFARLVTDFLLR